MKLRLKWVFLGVIIITGVTAAAVMPSAVENMLPEAAITVPVRHSHIRTVRGTGIIRGTPGTGFTLNAAVREGDINNVKVGQPAKLYGAAIGDGDYTAVVREIADVAFQREFMGITETVVNVVLTIDNTNGFTRASNADDDNDIAAIRPGYTAEAIISVSEPRELLLVPYEAINQDDKGEFVLVLVGHTAVRRDIITGLELAEGAEVLAGVREGDELIVNPERFTENMLVRRGD